MFIQFLRKRKLPCGEIELSGECRITRKEYTVTVKQEDLIKCLSGESVNKAFPYLRADQREFLSSGYSPEGLSKLFPRETED